MGADPNILPETVGVGARSVAAGGYGGSGLKRCLDLVGAGLGLLIFAPLMVLIGLALWIWQGRPILFCQTRIGRGNTPFRIFKFRTMREAWHPNGAPLADAKRLTRLGRFLRTTSLDELPQLFNVLRGEMSLIGPRPLLTQYLSQYTPTQARRHEVRPGVTGWAQINGRNQIDWPRRFQLDVWYVDHAGFWLDVKILLLTFGRVLSARGVHQPRSPITITEFQGNQNASIAVAEESRVPIRGPVVVLGAGGHAKSVIASLEAAGHEIAAIYDDNPALWGTRIMGCLVNGPVDQSCTAVGTAAVIAIGNPEVRFRLASRLAFHWISVVHPSAVVHSTVRIGPGAVVLAGAVVQPDSVIGDHVVINTGSTVDHDCTVAAFANIGPGTHLAGSVRIGEKADLGTGCAVIPGISIGPSSIIGAGGVVVEDIPSHAVAVGCPARIIRSLRTAA
jgi:sugar O-acyltransferase (sialic acid O-acetyltransferase NeuD family)